MIKSYLTGCSRRLNFFIDNRATLALAVALFVLILATKTSFGQGLRVGDWSNMLPTVYGNTVTQSENQIIYGCGSLLLLIDKQDGSIQRISREHGLSDTRIERVRYHAPTKTLVVTYQNSNIDLIVDGRVQNLNSIMENRAIAGDKKINQVSFGKNKNIFFSCNFGLVEYKITDRRFGFTLRTPVEIQNFVDWKGFYFIATEEGLYKIDPDRSVLLSDFGLWESIEHPSVSGGNIAALAADEQKLMISIGNQLIFTEDGENFSLLHQLTPNQKIEYIVKADEDWIIGFGCIGSSCVPGAVRIKVEGTIDQIPANCLSSPVEAIVDQFGRIWFADRFRDYRVLYPVESECRRLQFNSPFSENVTDIEVSGEKVYIASGGVQPNFGYVFREDGFFEYDGKTWFNHNKFTNPLIAQLDLRDFYKIKKHPRNELLYIGSYLDGLIEWRGPEDFTLYNRLNSSLGGTVGDIQRTRVSGLDFDREGNLWISNFLAENPISVLTKDGEWKNFPVPGSTMLAQNLVDFFGNKWFVVFRNGLLVFNEGGNIHDPSRHKYRLINTSNSVLPSNLVNCVAIDLDGALWVGTEQGIAVFECGADPFRENCRGNDRRLEQDGYGAILLSTEDIRTIAIDGANRKWIGTTNGIFVQSPNGSESIFIFNKDNSPLLDNNISTIKCDNERGLVYIGTASGVQVLRTDAIEGGAFFQSRVYAFPNPVRPEYDGPISIVGLARDANFKITDTDGRLVFEGRARGGQAEWNGRDFNGNRVQSGIYLVFSTYTGNLDFPTGHVTKIAVIR